MVPPLLHLRRTLAVVRVDRAFSWRRCEVVMNAETANPRHGRISRTTGNGGKRTGILGMGVDTN